MTVVQNLLEHGLEIVSSVVLVLLTALINRYVKNKAAAETLDGLLTNGVSYAEEKARQALNAGTEVTSSSKLETAIEFVVEELDRLGYPEMAKEKLTQYIEAKLSAERANPTGVVPSDPVVAPVATKAKK
jgi:hypothetical protein